MKSEVLIELSRPIGARSLAAIDVFRYRFRNLWENYDDLRANGLSLNGSFHKGASGKAESSVKLPSIHRLKGYYADFRPFILQKEACRYERICEIVSEHCEDKDVRDLIQSIRDSWKEDSPLCDWIGKEHRDIAFESLMDCVFNGVIFHSDSVKLERHRKCLSLMSSDTLNWLLLYYVHGRMLILKNLSWILAPLNKDDMRIRIPVTKRTHGAYQTH